MKEPTMEPAVQTLKDLIDTYGPDYLSREAYSVYTQLLKTSSLDHKTAAAFLHVLVSGVLEEVKSEDDEAQISVMIRNECSLNKKMADRLAKILHELYSREHQTEWSRKKKAGFTQFLNNELIVNWKGFSEWNDGSVSMDCHYEADIVLKPTKHVSKDTILKGMLKENPFLTKEAITKLFTNRLNEYLDEDFDEYCVSDYYPPVVEDYGINLEDNLEHWCEKNGFQLVSVEGDGSDDGYERSSFQSW
ncbi:MAG: hypothetical protein IJ225_00770 [Solobacterium sp.]|nr:hypothetical protein [Solobacterium sp.]